MITFYEEGHKYLDEKENQLLSVSGLAKLYEPEKDWDKICKRSAKSQGVSYEFLKAKWKDNNEWATKCGTKLHAIKEQELIDNDFEFEGLLLNKEIAEYQSKEYKKSTTQKVKNNSVYPEYLVYSDYYRICGQLDKLIIKDNTINVFDYKGLALDTEIPTSDGIKLIKDIKVGDEIYDGNGFLTRITNVSDVHDNPCYKITFDTNDTIICDHEHKWEIDMYENFLKKFKSIILTTDQMFEYIESNKNKRQSIPLRIKCTELKNERINLPIDPYVFGLWLGDGNSHCARITQMNPKVWEEIERRGYSLGNDVTAKNAISKAQDRTIFGLQGQLKNLGVLKNKHIPEIFFTASKEQRIDLLRGFMDADGHYNKARKRYVMSTTKHWQARDLMRLLSSLGVKSTLLKSIGSGFGKINIPILNVNFTTYEFNPFLSRNEDVLFTLKSLKKNSNVSDIHSNYRKINRIEKIETVPTKCLTVESNEHTFLVTRNYIKTHNSDKELKRKAYSSEWQAAETFLEPISHLEMCNWNEYALKMSVYMYLIWLNNRDLKMGNLILEHCVMKRDIEGRIEVDKDNNPIVLEIKEYKLPLLLKEAKLILEHYKNNHGIKTV